MRSRLDTFGVRTGRLQIPQEEQDPVRYLPLLVVVSVLPRRVLAAITIRVLARAQVPLDLALVDQVVVLPFPDDPDTPEKNVARSHAKSHACTCRTKGDAGHAGTVGVQQQQEHKLLSAGGNWQQQTLFHKKKRQHQKL